MLKQKQIKMLQSLKHFSEIYILYEYLLYKKKKLIKNFIFFNVGIK